MKNGTNGYHAIASALLSAGLSVVPARADKHPTLDAWKDYQTNLPLPEEIHDWFISQHPFGLGFVCGLISGGLEVLDLDAKHDPSGTLNTRAEAAIRDEIPGLWERLPIERTPSGGLHLYYRCSAPEKNLKLARQLDKDGKPMVVAETRGEGGFIVAAPTPGYILIQGQLTAVPFITDDERGSLLDAARSLDKVPPPVKRSQPPATPRTRGDFPPGFISPGDAYDASEDWRNLIQRHGWTEQHGHAWARPGKSHGTSATWDTLSDCPRHFFVFTGNAHPLEQDTAYTPFSLFAHLECGGDFKIAAEQLYDLGFGTRKKVKAVQPAPLGEVDFDDGQPVQQPTRALQDFTLPKDRDHATLLGNRYLCRGDGAVLSGTSGIGKSSLAILLAVLWALGRSALGIEPNGLLSSLIIQSEDSEGDMAEVWASIVHCLGLSPDEQVAVRQRVRIVTDRVNRGLAFHKALKDHVAATKPDLVWINPLQAFIDGDITKSQDLGAFLRGSLNSLNEPPSFAYILVHHTTKPATGKDRTERLWHEVMYDMAGGAELINWARAILSLRPATNPGDFNLILAKRGRRAGIVREVPQGTGFRMEPVTVIPLKHAQGTIPIEGRASPMPLVFWESRPADVPPEAAKSSKGGRPSKHEFNDYRNIFPPNSGPGMEIGALAKLMDQNLPISKSTLHDALKRWEVDGFVECLKPEGRPMRYRASNLVGFVSENKGAK